MSGRLRQEALFGSLDRARFAFQVFVAGGFLDVYELGFALSASGCRVSYRRGLHFQIFEKYVICN